MNSAREAHEKINARGWDAEGNPLLAWDEDFCCECQEVYTHDDLRIDAQSGDYYCDDCRETAPEEVKARWDFEDYGPPECVALMIVPQTGGAK